MGASDIETNLRRLVCREAIRSSSTAAMCERCKEIDRKIERYRALAKQILDSITNEETEKLVQDLIAERAALHSDRQN